MRRPFRGVAGCTCGPAQARHGHKARPLPELEAGADRSGGLAGLLSPSACSGAETHWSQRAPEKMGHCAHRGCPAREPWRCLDPGLLQWLLEEKERALVVLQETVKDLTWKRSGEATEMERPSESPPLRTGSSGFGSHGMFTGTESRRHRAAAAPGRTCRTPGGQRASRLEAERGRPALRSGPGDLAKLSGLREAQDGLTFDPLAELGSEDLGLDAVGTKRLIAAHMEDGGSSWREGGVPRA
ncbi:hypothetical protein MG293_019238 [Ovis ammon polii]|uniref:Uncharacterized protein n=1 Tax=Ovis ammon polii TaxID=230172 RepID=A0AAD4Y0C7_OVIAM|nr:hypothetical protein MG293_019238 [Ovis ammon polii]